VKYIAFLEAKAELANARVTAAELPLFGYVEVDF
jgi:hypothetical protein